MEARKTEQSEQEIFGHLNEALQFCNQALELIPSDAVIELGIGHYQLGLLNTQASNLSHAMMHYREAIRYYEIQGDTFGAAQTRHNVAVLLMQTGRRVDAREYAYAALRNFETYGDRAADDIQQRRGLIQWIEQKIQEQGG